MKAESAIELFNESAVAPILLLCDHAGNKVPGDLDRLGLDNNSLERHIAWDIGAAQVTRVLATELDAPAILNHTSRLVIDVNRRPLTHGSIPAVSDGCVVPGNSSLSREAINQRIRRYFLPYHRCVAQKIAAKISRGIAPVIVAVHSFTPVMDGETRPWHVGVMWRSDKRVAHPAMSALQKIDGMIVGDNQPYSGFRAFGYTINFHAQRPHLPHVMFELRQDEIATGSHAERYGLILADVLKPILQQQEIYQKYTGNNLVESGGLMSWRQASLVSP